MIKVAVCGNIKLEEGDLASSLNRCAKQEHVDYSLAQYENPIDLIDACSKAFMEEPLDLVICAVDLAGVSGVQLVSDLNDLHTFADDLRIVLCAQTADHAYDAQVLGVNGYLVEPVASARFDRVIGRQLREIAGMHAESLIIRCRDRMRRIVLSRLSYAATSGHDQELHHVSDAIACTMRGSSSDLFSLLENDGRFFKVGSSYIVNLDHVARLDSKNGHAVLANGVEIPVPVRARKALEQALLGRS